MNDIKYLKWAAIVTMFFLSIYLIAGTNRALNDYSGTNTVSFTGEGKVLAKPDVAIASLAIVTDSATSKGAQDDNNNKSKAVVDFLKGNGVEEKDIKTTGYNIYPQYTYPPYGKAQITGYQVNQTMEVKVRDLGKVSAILDGVVTAGVNQVNNLGFQVDNPEALKTQAREMAIENAKTKAGDLRGDLDIRLGKIVNFSESIAGEFPPMYYADARGQGAGGYGGGGPTTPVGENEIIVNVTITYQVK